MGAKPWTDATIETLKTLVAEGLTYSQIAKQMGVTRVAAIGKAYRLGLTSQSGCKGGNSHYTARKQIASKRVVLPPLPLPEIRVEAPKPEVFRMGSVNAILHLRGCKFPIGDTAASDFHFCNSEPYAGFPYCSAHAAMAYRVRRV